MNESQEQRIKNLEAEIAILKEQLVDKNRTIQGHVKSNKFLYDKNAKLSDLNKALTSRLNPLGSFAKTAAMALIMGNPFPQRFRETVRESVGTENYQEFISCETFDNYSNDKQ